MKQRKRAMAAILSFAVVLAGFYVSPGSVKAEDTAPSENETAEIYLQYLSDDEWTQEIGFMDLSYRVTVDGNGEYQIRFVAAAGTDNIYRLCLHTYKDPEELPSGMKITPTILRVGDKTYTIGECVEDDQYGYRVSIQDLLYGRDSIRGDVPVTAGDTVTLQFRIEGMKHEGTLGTSPSSPAPTETVAAQETEQPAATETAATIKPAGTDKPAGTKNTFTPKPVNKKPKKVTLKKVKALGNRRALVRWKWFIDQDGFQLQYVPNRSFTKKTKNQYKDFVTDTVTVKKLKKGKNYYFRVRAFNGSGSAKKYGKWSKVRKCRII